MIEVNPAATETRLAVQKLDELPAMSLVVHELLRAIDEDLELRELSRIIEKDPALVARIVGLANAAYFGAPERITTVEEAIFKVLGVNITKSLALGIVLSGPFDAGRCRGFPLDRYWRNALGAALAAQRLAGAVSAAPKPTPGAAYLCGLLHDFGLLALVHLYPEEMDTVFGRLQDGEGELTQLERDLLGADHHQVGGWLARKWHLQGPAVAVIENYRNPAYRGDYWPLVRLVAVCAAASEPLFDGAAGEPDWTALQELGLGAAAAERVLGDLTSRREEITALAAQLV